MTANGLLRNSSFLAGVFAILVGIAWGLSSFAMRDAALGDPNAPRYFPWLVSALSVICGIILVVREIIRAVPDAKPVSFQFNSVYRAAAIGTGLGLVYAYIFESAGFILSTILFVGGITFAYNGLARWKSNIVTAVGFTVVVYFIFTTLGTPLEAFPSF